MKTNRRYHRPGQTPGSVYLLCAESCLGNEKHQARHYLGFAVHLRDRILSHHTDHPTATPKIVHAMNERGIKWRVARVWTSEQSPSLPDYLPEPLLVEALPGVTEKMEKRLKRRHNHRALCPICSQRPQPGRERTQKCKGN